MDTMNFFTPLLASRKKKSFHKRIVVYLSLCAVLLFAGSYGYLRYVIMEHQSLITVYNSQLQQNSTRRSEYEEQIKIMNNKQEYLSLLSTMVDSGRVVKTLSYIEKSIPDEMYITSVMISADDISINAVSSGNIDIADFERKLRLFDLFEDSHVNVINTGNGCTAAIKCKYKATIEVIN